DRFSLLFVGIATHHRVVLLAWELVPYGSTDAETQLRLLKRIYPLLPEAQRVRITLFGDAEFRAVDLQQYCRDQHWQWQLGVKSDTLYHDGDGLWRPLRTIPISKGQRR